MIIREYLQGNVVKLKATFRDEGSALVDPSDVSLELKSPGNVETTYSPVQESEGVYNYNFDTTGAEPGLWWARIISTDPSSAQELAFRVKRSALA